MTAALIAVAALAAALTGALVFVLVDLRRLMSALVAARTETVAADARASEYERQRDAATEREARAKEREAAALVRLKLAEARANESSQEEARRAVESIRAKSAADAVVALDELLGTEILPQAGDAGADRDGG